MVVIAALNGSLTSEASTYYALHYSKIHGFGLHLLHVHNTVDSREAVVRSMANLEIEGRRLGSRWSVSFSRGSQ